MATVSSLLKINGCVRLPHLAALDVKGADAEKFLQGQTSAQVSLANGFFAPLTCFCTPKGRMLANAQLLKISNDHYRLLLSTSLIDMLASHLAKFAAFYRVELQAQSSMLIVGASESANEVAQAFGLALPDQPYTHHSNAQATALCQPGGGRWLISIENSAEQNAIAINDDEDALNTWQLADIRSGLAWLTAPQQDHFLPQMLNWEALGGISFKKGCYTGQEVVARAHFRGQVKKRLVRVTASVNSLPQIGDTLVDEQDKTVGEIVSSAFSDKQQIEMLAVANTKAIEALSPLYWQGHPVTLCDLPYTVERLDPEQLASSLTA
ncbi:MAG: CAF17-like 4Fe-4S cluster assembly/insertion protein YgfZ [Vreelandella alkaliphila]|uniref:Folate-binding protein n=1 Tax=Halomonas campaniensis TaxID=213554 RepID=A0A3D0KFC0_9GAMM|nr:MULTISPECIES: folate-binding protein YgfZ [unclassified Halomonas]HBP42243.1 folate-binding protein [Halomonas sp.]HBS83729.1 folate-binding protein [Halomonas campaniensis]HCA02186.1 folate-binding protein [Halomonas campaniensis]